MTRVDKPRNSMITDRVRQGLWLCALAGCAADAPATAPAAGGAVAPSDAAGRLARATALIRPGSVTQTDPRFGVPTVLWAHAAASASAAAAGTAHPELAASRTTLASYAALYHLADADVAGAVVSGVHDLGTGPILVEYRAPLGGIEVFGEQLTVVMNRALEPVALTGYLTSTSAPPVSAAGLAFTQAAPAGALAAISDLAHTAIDAAWLVPAGSQNGYDGFTLAPSAGIALDAPVRLKKVYYHAADGLEAAYYVEVAAHTGPAPRGVLSLDGSPIKTTEAYGYLVSAATGQVLSRKNLISDAVAAQASEPTALTPGFTYRVWADPVTGVPLDTPAGNDADPKAAPVPDGWQSQFAAPSDVNLTNFPFSRNDPWLPPGATETVGNNVDAYVDLLAPDGFGTPTTTAPSDPVTADFRAQITAPGQFLHSQIPDGNGMLAEGRQGAIQQLFYNLNFLHDWYYDAGFDEVAGNAQTDNFGRGGIAGDSIRAEAQDFGGYSNANMQTPADGGRPIMQMYMFPSVANRFEIVPPSIVASKNAMGISMSGPQTYDLTAELAVATFASSPGCAVTNPDALAGRIAVFYYDNTDGTGCAYPARLAALATTQAQAIVMVNTAVTPDGLGNFVGLRPTIPQILTVVSWNTGQVISAGQQLSPPVTARLVRAPDRDGALDNQIVFHEFFHYVSNRLAGGGLGLDSNLPQAGGMGEGWSDMNAMLLTVRDNDTATPSNATYNGTYALATYATSGVPFDASANQGYYYGIRRYPYSTDMTKNPLTFKHITQGVALPVGPPVRFGADGASNQEVHNTGEVWTTMLWECYAGLLRDTLGSAPRLTFHDAQRRMQRYLIAALKATPFRTTFAEARDALLAVALASDPADYAVFRAGFAKRGAGARAVAPSTFSPFNEGIVEDFTTDFYVTTTLDDSLGSCDGDGVLDHGEYGKLTITLQNAGVTAFAATTATISSPSPGVWFPDGPAVAFPALALDGTATATVRVAYLPGATGIQPLDFRLSYAGAQDKLVEFRGNTDELASASATDAVEADGSTETTGFAATLGDVAPWHRIALSPMQHAWHVDNAPRTADQYLISPPLTVDAGGSLHIEFDHAWSFGTDPIASYLSVYDDGGVVEMSVNGAAYTDIGGPAYNGFLWNYPGDTNPLASHAAFVGRSQATLHTSLTQAVAPGSTVRVRFRFVSDIVQQVPSAGWTVDNIAYAGVVERPFAELVADTHACGKLASSADLAIAVSDGASAVRPGGVVSYTITASNGSTGDVLGATVADAFSSDLACTWTCVASPGGACAAAGSGPILDRVTLPAGGTVTYAAACAVSATITGASLSNTASVAPPGPVADPAPENNAATDTDAVIRTASHLTAEKTVAGTFAQGGTVVYTITLGNDGAGTQLDNPGDELVDVLPAGLTLISASATAGTAVAALAGNTVTWNGEIAPGGTATITIVARITAPAGTTISNQAVFRYDSDGDSINDASGTTDAYVCAPSI